MAPKWCKAKVTATAPATLMFFGEHSVLRFGPAVVAAVDGYLTVELETRPDDQIVVISDLGQETTNRHEILLSNTFRFVAAVFKAVQDTIVTGFTCKISTNFSSTQGLGSSAAVTIATLGALQKLFGFSGDLHMIALNVVRKVQGRGSGADLAASLLGGIIAYQCTPTVEMKRIASSLDITVCFSGYKTSTSEVIRQVEESEKQNPELILELLKIQRDTAKQAAVAIAQHDLQKLKFLTQVSQGVMEALGVSDPIMSQIVWQLRQDPGIYGSKISGSGLGDCVIGFGHLQKPSSLTILPYKISQTGLVIE